MPNTLPPFDPTVPGTLLAGKYRVERTLGMGGMGVVVAARHVGLDEQVALKFLLPEHAQDPESSGRFLREARAAVKIKSEHVARVSDVGTLDTGNPYMVMELLDGSDLGAVVDASGGLPIADAVDYVIQAAEALAEAHGYGIIHRDIKPSNLFLARRPNGTPLVKVLDFGISKVSGEGVDKLTRPNAAMGSACYMAPEQMRDASGVDIRTDVYSLGVSLYEMLTARLPFEADSIAKMCAEVLMGTPKPIRDRRPDVPPALAAVIERAFARDPSARYASIGELVAALLPFAPLRSRSVVEGMTTQDIRHSATLGSSALSLAVPPIPRSRTGLAIGLGAALAVACGCLGLFFATRGHGTKPLAAQDAPSIATQVSTAAPPPAVTPVPSATESAAAAPTTTAAATASAAPPASAAGHPSVRPRSHAGPGKRVIDVGF